MAAEKQKDVLARIEINPKIMVGKPVIRGTRLTVQHILGLMASGATAEEILNEYNRLTPEDLQACLMFASQLLESTTFGPPVNEETNEGDEGFVVRRLSARDSMR